MLMKRSFFVLLAITVIFCFPFPCTASDAKKTENKPVVNTEAKQESGAGIKSDAKAATESEAQSQKTGIKKININKANAIELSSVLRKVGPKYAEAIVTYREENGEFKSPEDIKKVKGIGNKIFELNKDAITVTD